MKKIILSGILIVATVIAFTSNNLVNSKKSNETTTNITLSGKVIDMVSGEALTGVGVEIEGTNQKVYTDFDGNYKISNLKAGEYNVIASYISYNKSYIEKINVNNDKALNIKLQTSN